jgi:hypothetical protein
VREAVILSFPDRRAGTGLYAFVEADGVAEADLQGFLSAQRGAAKPPERLQIVNSLPRGPDNVVRTEILALVATNQLDLVETLPISERERPIVEGILAGRKNLRDRFAV